ncbi:hypothetical protein J437_LFUL011974, partial [Ladona fulva]
MDHNIQALTWNCHGLKNKLNELLQFLYDWNIICALQETHLSTKIIYSPNYQIIRNDRSTPGGGVAILIHSNIKLSILPRIKLNIIEYVGISVISNNNPINLYKKSIWKTTKALTNNTQPPTRLLHNNTLYSDPQTKANIFADYIKQIMTAPPLTNKNDNNIITHNSILDSTPISEPKYITCDKIKNLINTLKTHKAPGYDNVTNHMLKLVSRIPHVIHLLADIFNNCLLTSYFRTQWKLGI